jgi:predicted phosphodiesterase
VHGNCDCNPDWPHEDRFTFHGQRFLLIHAPPRTAPAGIDILLHGHTHVPRDEMLSGVRFLNPGTVGRANKGAPPSYAWLSFGEDGSMTWEIVRV